MDRPALSSAAAVLLCGGGLEGIKAWPTAAALLDGDKGLLDYSVAMRRRTSDSATVGRRCCMRFQRGVVLSRECDASFIGNRKNLRWPRLS